MARRDEAEEYSLAHIHSCICRDRGYVRLNVPTNHPLFGKAIPCACKRNQQAAAIGRKLRAMSGLSETEYEAYTFEQFKPVLCAPAKSMTDSEMKRFIAYMKQTKETCEAYAKSPGIKWLVLSGSVGTGKTHLAKSIAASQLQYGRQCFVSTWPDLLDLLRAGYQKDAKDNMQQRLDWIKQVELLVIDDLGVEARTDWGLEQLYRVVNWRYDNNKPLVLTTNLSTEQLTRLEARVASRLSEGAQTDNGRVVWVKLICGDFRPHRRLTI